MNLKRALFIARKDLSYMLRDRTTLIWLAVMPGLFFYFIGTATGGASSGPTRENVAVKRPADAGFLADQLALRLDQAGLNVVTFDAGDPTVPLSGGSPEIAFDGYCRQLTLPPGLTDTVQQGEPAQIQYQSCRDELGAEFDKLRAQRAVYTTLADIIAIGSAGEGVSQAAMDDLNATPRALQLQVRSAGKRQDPPQGFQQAVPGTMVMFTLLLLLTSGAIDLMIERQRGLLTRLASAPLLRRDIVLGKWLGKMALAVCQIAIGMTIGWLLFDISWQPDLPMIVLLLLAWASVCTSMALVLGSLGRTEGQVAGVGILLAMLLAGLGGCWWPIEIAPPWMQTLAGLLPTGWTMNGLHHLMLFESGAAAVVPEVLALTGLALVLGVLAVRVFRYQ